MTLLLLLLYSLCKYIVSGFLSKGFRVSVCQVSGQKIQIFIPQRFLFEEASLKERTRTHSFDTNSLCLSHCLSLSLLSSSVSSAVLVVFRCSFFKREREDALFVVLFSKRWSGRHSTRMMIRSVANTIGIIIIARETLTT